MQAVVLVLCEKIIIARVNVKHKGTFLVGENTTNNTRLFTDHKLHEMIISYTVAYQKKKTIDQSKVNLYNAIKIPNKNPTGTCLHVAGPRVSLWCPRAKANLRVQAIQPQSNRDCQLRQL